MMLDYAHHYPPTPPVPRMYFYHNCTLAGVGIGLIISGIACKSYIKSAEAAVKAADATERAADVAEL